MARGCSVQGCPAGRAFQCYECGDRFCVVNKHARQCPRCRNHVCNKDWKDHEKLGGRCLSIFRLEKGLQSVLEQKLPQLEGGLKLYGVQRIVMDGRGRTDIEAIDKDRNRVVIELKAKRADLKALAQIRRYMADVAEELKKQKKSRSQVRGILVAPSFRPEVIREATSGLEVELRPYTFDFLFPD
jgi:RecB family endonuclease NucS